MESNNDNKVLTPSVIWQDFDPKTNELNPKLFRRSEIDGIIVSGYVIDALYYGESRVQIPVYVIAGHEDRRRPVIVYVKDPSENIDIDLWLYAAKKGVTVITFDYAGTGEDAGKVYYPESLKYGYYENSNAELNRVETNAIRTPLHVWSRITRRVLTFAEQLQEADADKICVIGSRRGANMLWQTAATDYRVKSGVTIANAGRNAVELPTADDDTAVQKFAAGCAIEVYAKFVKIPMLYVGGSNNDLTSIERVLDTMGLLKDYRIEFCANLGRHIYDTALITVEKFITSTLLDGKMPAQPKVELSVGEGQLKASIKADNLTDTIAGVKLHYAYAGQKAALRYWHTEDAGVNISGEGNVIIPVHSAAEKLLIYCDICYKTGYTLSSAPIQAVPAEYGDITPAVHLHRIIYDRTKGVSSWVSESGTLIVRKGDVSICSGIMELSGLATSGDNLASYAVSDVQVGADAILQFDCFSETCREFSLQLLALHDGAETAYTAHIAVEGGSWSKIALEPQMFKSDFMMPLRDWSGICKMTFIGVKSILFNNILWV